MSAPTLAATPERGVSTTPVGDAGQPDRLATVRMPTAAAMAVRLGLPGVSGRLAASSRTDAVEGPIVSVPAAEHAEGAPRIDIVLQDDGAGDVRVDGTPVATRINVAETYTAIVALVLDTAGKAGRPAQVSVISGDSIRRTLVAPDGSIRRLGADARHTIDRPPAVVDPAAPTRLRHRRARPRCCRDRGLASGCGNRCCRSRMRR